MKKSKLNLWEFSRSIFWSFEALKVNYLVFSPKHGIYSFTCILTSPAWKWQHCPENNFIPTIPKVLSVLMRVVLILNQTCKCSTYSGRGHYLIPGQSNPFEKWPFCCCWHTYPKAILVKALQIFGDDKAILQTFISHLSF